MWTFLLEYFFSTKADSMHEAGWSGPIKIASLSACGGLMIVFCELLINLDELSILRESSSYFGWALNTSGELLILWGKFVMFRWALNILGWALNTLEELLILWRKFVMFQWALIILGWTLNILSLTYVIIASYVHDPNSFSP